VARWPGGGRRAGLPARSATDAGNTPAQCRASRVDPKVFELFEEGRPSPPVFTRLGEHGNFGCPAAQGAVEAAALDLLGG
jgi:hypothetical protein